MLRELDGTGLLRNGLPWTRPCAPVPPVAEEVQLKAGIEPPRRSSGEKVRWGWAVRGAKDVTARMRMWERAHRSRTPDDTSSAHEQALFTACADGLRPN